MTTNQTIDGVRKYVMHLTDEAHSVLLGMVEHCLNIRACMGMDEGFKDFDTEEEHGFVKELRALLDAPVYPQIKWVRAHKYYCACVTGDSECDCGAVVDGVAQPAAQPQGEPVAFIQIPKNVEKYGHGDQPDRLSFGKPGQFFVNGESPMFDFVLLYTEQPAPVAVVPDGYCIMPRQLTAENGAKALLLGEFKLLVTKECPECCELEEPTEGCSICDGEGEYGQTHTIPWDQIKYIYSKAVSGLAVKTQSAKSR